MYNPDKFKAARTSPLQARGKERVRVILAASLELFKRYGIEAVTTNDIAAQARIPIGSLYRYYPNKDSIVKALTDLYVADLTAAFESIGEHPMLKYLSWDEVLLLMVDSWVSYARLNGRYPLLYAQKFNPRLRQLNKTAWEEFIASFEAVLKKRCPAVTKRELTVCFQLSVAAAEMGISEEFDKSAGPNLHYEAVGAVARYMLEACNRHAHGSPA
ncbi:MAG TPA: TetR/AcrR family transcriptional regulator [Patescibacteria group bacterium]|nr:TetR/AcrR family transcriptional regulator [Patescibacteria group bacterium]